MSEGKRHCLCCVDLRRGIIALLVLEFIVTVAAAVLLALGVAGIKVNAAANNGNVVDNGKVVAGKDDVTEVTTYALVGAAIYGAQAAWTLFGLITVLKRKVHGFSIFAKVTAVFTLLNIVSLALTPNGGSIAGALLSAYVSYVFLRYAKTMRIDEQHQKLGQSDV
ncbi:hypothetical protein H9P43_008397 [Blastocladiella emersonii ATCC 22665]|nr:hypothetical protein H9P43_008397 [Blastocladiella emersonii ATCC 22665]